MLGAQELPRLAGFSLIASCGTLLAAVGAGSAAVSGAALYYLVASTLGVRALFLLIELVERGRAPGADLLAITEEAFGGFDAEEREDVGVVIPAVWAVLGLAFVACVLMLAGLPPLPGFVAKAALLSALLAPEAVAPSAWVLLALLMLSGLATVVAASRTGVRIFWMPEQQLAARVRVIEMLPIVLLLGIGLALTVLAGPAMRYLDDAAQGPARRRLRRQGARMKRVLPFPPLAGADALPAAAGGRHGSATCCWAPCSPGVRAWPTGGSRSRTAKGGAWRRTVAWRCGCWPKWRRTSCAPTSPSPASC